MLYRKFPIAAVLALATLPVCLQAARIFMVGNSVTDSVNYNQFQQLAQSRGYTHIWGRHIILGSPLDNIWNNPDSGFLTAPFNGYANALPNYDWDAVTLQTYDRGFASDLDYFGRFMDLARTRPYNAANTEFFTFARWPRQEKGDYSTYWVLPSDGSTQRSETADYFEKLTIALREAHPGVSIRMIPVGHVFYELEQRMKEGLIPGYTNVYDGFYSDGVHQNDSGRYVTALTFFTTIYKDDPRGLPLAGFNVTPQAAAIFQEVVWEVVTRTPLSGVVANEGLTITTTRLPRASVNRSYTTTLRALFGAEPYTWTITSGSLPAGITLASNGLLSGTATTAGEYPITIEVTDSTGEKATAETVFHVVVNTVPDITTPAALPAGFMGTPYNIQLTASAGDPPLVWRRTAGRFPIGLSLTPEGRLYGTPGEQGNFTFTIQVDDDDFPADSDSQAFTLSIGAPQANTVSVPRILQPVTIDGVHSESFWNFNRTASTIALGSTDAVARFATAWDVSYLYLALQVDDTTPNGGLSSPSSNDSIEILLDGLHDRETVYNADDRRFIIQRTGETVEIFGRGAGWITAVQTSANGYNIEIAVPWDNLSRTPYPGMGVGFDLILNDNQNSSGRAAAVTWNGSDANEPAPLTFGNLQLSATVSGPVTGDVLIAYEPFSGPAGPLSGSGVPLGFSAPWTQQNFNASLTGYDITDVSLPTYGNHRTYGELHTQGMRATGGRDHTNAGRNLDVNGAFSSYAASNSIGKAGTSLWFSWLIRPDSGGVSARVAFCPPGVDWSPSDYRIKVEQSGGNWTFQIGAEATINTGVPVVAGQTYLMVVNVEFGSPTTAKLFVNPTTLGGDAPETPTASGSTMGNMGIGRIHWYPGNSQGSATLDEIRIGSSYAAVTPIKLYPPIFDVHPQSATISEGGSITLTAEVYSRSPVTYQWFRNNILMEGENQPTLSITNASGDDFASYTLRATNASGFSVSETAVISMNPYPSDEYAAWANGKSWANTDASLPTADADNDGLTNLYEYLFDMNPLVPDSTLPNVMSIEAADGEVVFTFAPVRIDPSLSITIETSADLVTWTSGTHTIETTDGPAGFRTYTLRAPNASLQGSSLFARLTATLVE